MDNQATALVVHVTSAPAEELFIKELPINWFDNPFMHQTTTLDSLFYNDENAYEPVLTMVNGVPYSILAWKEGAQPHEDAFCSSTALPEPLYIFRLNLKDIPVSDMETIGHALDKHYGDQRPDLLLAPQWGVLTPEFNNYTEEPAFIWGKYIMACRTDNHGLLPLFQSALDIPEVKTILTKHTITTHASKVPHTPYEVPGA